MRYWITRALSALDYDVADKIKRDFRVKERTYKKVIKELEKDKQSYLTQIAENEARHAADMADIKRLLSDIQEELAEVKDLYSKTSIELEKKKAAEIDLSGMLEAFMEAYPEMSLLEISKKRNPQTIP